MRNRQEVFYERIKSKRDKKYIDLNEAIKNGDTILEEKLRKECVNLDIKCNKQYMYYMIHENSLSINIDDKKNTISSFILSLLSIFLMSELLIIADNVYKLISILVFGILEFLIFLLDSFYHSLKKRYKIKRKIGNIVNGAKAFRTLSIFGILPLLVLKNNIGIMVFVISLLFAALYMMISNTEWMNSKGIVNGILLGLIYVSSFIVMPYLIKENVMALFIIIISEMIYLIGKSMDNRKNTEISHLLFHILNGISLILFSLSIMYI